MRRIRAILLALALGIVAATAAQVTYTTTTSADAFVMTGSTNNPLGSDLSGLNYGGAGTLVIASAASEKGEFRSVIRFDLAAATNQFNATFGTNWTIRGISLEFASNYGQGGVQPNNPIFNMISGGDFVIEWLSDDSWLEGTGNPNLPTTDGVTFDDLPALLAAGHEVLCTNTYVPPGVDVHVTWPLPVTSNLVSHVRSSGQVSFYFYAADDEVNYLFNSLRYGRGNEPLIHVTAGPFLKILSGSFTNGAFHLTGIGGTNATYQVQANSDLSSTNWQNIGTVTTDGAGALHFDDVTATSQSRFYRLAD